MYRFYRTLTYAISPFVPLVLKARLARGKEDGMRMQERFGIASLPRPPGKLVWVHAASVGEANAIVPLVENLLNEHPALHILLTTVTVTSAALMGKRLPPRALHQFAPVDTPSSVRSFLTHWHPDIALWVDSELWPNLLVETEKSGAVMGLINARISERSYRRWRRIPSFIRTMLSGFTLCFAQSDEHGERLSALGVKHITRIGNLKYDTPPLPYEEAELTRLRETLGDRPAWVAASTHPGEEASIAEVHRMLTAQGMRPLTVIVPRHATRGSEIAGQLAPLNVARRSGGEPLTPETEIYLADTMGELGLFYRLASVSFIGGTLVAHGGQNPLEPARLGCAVVAGPHMENFAAMTKDMERAGAIIRVQSARELAVEVARLLGDIQSRKQLGANAQAHVRSHAGVLAVITQELRPYLA